MNSQRNCPVIIKNKHQRKLYKEAGKLSTRILWELYQMTASGVYPVEIDQKAGQLCHHYGVEPSFFGVKGKHNDYQFNTCIQVNDQVVHGIPSSTRAFQDGDLVTVDFGITYQGLYTDHCFSVGLDKVDPDDQKLLKVGRQAVWQATQKAIIGGTTGDIGHTILQIAEESGFTTAKKYTGHGIGKSLHEMPEIPAFGELGTGARLEKGMVLCVEAQIMAGGDQTVIDKDGWTVRSKDGANSVMFEYLVIVGKRQPLVLTPTNEWPLVK